MELHHIDGDRSRSVAENLIAICATCHTLVEKHLISESDLAFWKRMLVNGHHPRLAPLNDLQPGISVGLNQGQVADKIVNHFGESKKGPIILPNTIGSDAKTYNYVEYLVKRLAEWREKGSYYGQRRFGKVHPGVVRNQIFNEWGALPKDMPLESADALIDSLKIKIDKTAFGSNNRSRGIRNYHSIEEHEKRASGGKRSTP